MAYETLARRLYGFRDHRRNAIASLNEMRASIQAVLPANILATTLNPYTSWSNFQNNLKGSAADQIATVFLTGGSSQLPILRATVAAALPQARMATGDMLGSVGTGLALDARRRFG